MSNDLYPELSELGKKKAQEVMDSFKAEMKSIAEGALADLYCDVSCYIESDHWQNYKNKIMYGLTDWRNCREHEHDFKQIRRAMFEEYKEEIMKQMPEELIRENKELKERLASLRESMYR